MIDTLLKVHSLSNPKRNCVWYAYSQHGHIPSFSRMERGRECWVSCLRTQRNQWWSSHVLNQRPSNHVIDPCWWMLLIWKHPVAVDGSCLEQCLYYPATYSWQMMLMSISQLRAKWNICQEKFLSVYVYCTCPENGGNQLWLLEKFGNTGSLQFLKVQNTAIQTLHHSKTSNAGIPSIPA